jgi:hypothetical protein
VISRQKQAKLYPRIKPQINASMHQDEKWKKTNSTKLESFTLSSFFQLLHLLAETSEQRSRQFLYI